MKLRTPGVIKNHRPQIGRKDLSIDPEPKKISRPCVEKGKRVEVN